ncbi:MAG: DUF3105 domain-containing protein [Cellulomonadaceae bacterium]|nr:DUF3105 domain-containing protein [Cellulomonadaceae bacterium]
MVPAVVLLAGEQRREAALERAAREPVAGETRVDVDGREVRTPVVYAQVPPVGGDHDPVWQRCGFYTAPVRAENAVASLARGAVWVTYEPDLPSDQVELLRRLSGDGWSLVVSPFAGLPTPVVASAWGVQVTLPDARDERLEVFVRRYQDGAQAVRSGDACQGGTDAPLG